MPRNGQQCQMIARMLVLTSMRCYLKNSTFPNSMDTLLFDTPPPPTPPVKKLCIHLRNRKLPSSLSSSKDRKNLFLCFSVPAVFCEMLLPNYYFLLCHVRVFVPPPCENSAYNCVIANYPPVGRSVAASLNIL